MYNSVRRGALNRFTTAIVTTVKLQFGELGVGPIDLG
ncbi:hypothetical protein CPT_Musica_044 [Burkholderia phage Musica]|uniref:Uncharacterized protein n=1 Tax=Burkholderia phage Musica TaxID=2924903 RepID=A0AAE9K4R8_9CAUD|nr:hypothetical protein CPT_Musica_044 [Burkholderia phage Musica]